MLHHSPADPLLLWHKKTPSKTWLFHKKKHKLQAVCALLREFTARLVSPVTDSSLMWSLLVLEHLHLLLGGWMWRGDVHKLTGRGATLATKTTVMDGGWLGGRMCGFRDAVGKSGLEKPERTPCGASSSPGKGRSEEGDGMG